MESTRKEQVMKRIAIAIVLGIASAFFVAPSVASGGNVAQVRSQVVESQVVESQLVRSQLVRSQLVRSQVVRQGLVRSQRASALRLSQLRAQLR
jgi:hypothetical protein